MNGLSQQQQQRPHRKIVSFSLIKDLKKRERAPHTYQREREGMILQFPERRTINSALAKTGRERQRHTQLHIYDDDSNNDLLQQQLITQVVPEEVKTSL